jgi:cation diffusion facilitator CzcD-associated flavoprotein CzcO
MTISVATTNTHYDAIVIGAGFGGIRMLYELGKRGFSARAFEAGSGVGGTWYWNRCEQHPARGSRITVVLFHPFAQV